MWSTRRELPGLLRLSKVRFDPVRLAQDYHSLAARSVHNGLSAQYHGLCEIHKQLPQFFLADYEQPDERASYSQLALSEWDESYRLNEREEKSGTRWDYTIAKGDPRADERFYRKPVADLPEYLTSVLETFRPHLHRCRYAKLRANGSVKPHIDYDTTYSVRLHIPIVTNEACQNGYQDLAGESNECHLPADGGVWFVNQGLKHWALNRGATDRVHLILSVDSQELLRKFR